jgi:transcriptional antiterminator RfaH
MRSWYLIQTKPRQEYIAQENLERQGYRIYLPLAPVRGRRRGRTYTRIGPMFPRYLFIYLSEGVDDWGPIRSTLGVNCIVRFGQLPARVPEALIAVLREREDEKGLQSLPVKIPASGDVLRIAEGPLEGYEGLFYARTSKDRVIILIRLLEQYTKVDVAMDKIEIID